MSIFKVYLTGKKQYSLNEDQDLKGEGGQAKVYIKDKLAFKIYHDQNNMLPLGKIQELSVLDHLQIIKPEDIIYSQANLPIGYTMRALNNSHALSELFANDFKNENDIYQDDIYKLVQQLRDLVEFVHQKNILIVDLNEFNILLNEKINQINLIDVDSYITKSYKDNIFIMDNVKDVHSKTFSKLTDWFSFAINAFQMMVGAHPYQGGTCYKFDSLPIEKRMFARMQANLSALNTKEVKLPKCCYPINQLPSSYLQWFQAVLEQGKRLPPPKDFNNVVAIVQAVVQQLGSNSLDIKKIKDFTSNILNLFYLDHYQYISTQKTIEIISGNEEYKDPPKNYKVIIEQQTGKPILVYLKDQKLILFDLKDNKQLSCDVECSAMMVYQNRLYIKNRDIIAEIKLFCLGNSIAVSPKPVAQCSQSGTLLLEGLAIQSLLKTCYITLFPRSGESYSLRINELEGYRLLDAKFDNNVLMAIRFKNGHYDRLVIRFDKEYQSYDCRIVNDIIYQGLNFITLDNNVCLCLNEEEKLEVFNNQKNSSKMKIIDDPILNSNNKLLKHGGKVYFANGKELFSMRMK